MLAVLVVGPAVWAWSVADQLPVEVARHWGTGGNVTGVWPLRVQLVVLGIFTLHIARLIDDIAGADVATVDPFWEFGGWGLRVDTAGRTGIVIRKGSALVLRRGDDSEIVITSDYPERAVATINTYADDRFGSRAT